MIGPAEPKHELNDYVLLADPDLPVAAGTPVELLRDPPDQPRLVALGGQAEQGLSGVGQIVVHAVLALSTALEIVALTPLDAGQAL
jgi:hypothetical protein